MLELEDLGTVHATFTVPGVITIPADCEKHYVTVTELHLAAALEWACVPKKHTRVHMKAKVKNDSEYTLLLGPASVYVDGSFVARTTLPPVGPNELFDCPLGLDPSIKVTYPPVSKKESQSGLLNKQRVRSYTQTIAVHNAKATAIQRLHILDHIPVSEDAEIAVKLITPSLTAPGGAKPPAAPVAPRPAHRQSFQASVEQLKSSTLTVFENPPGESSTVSEGVQAMWAGADEEDVQPVTLGKDGKVKWTCAVPAQGKATLTLQWEVSAAPKTTVSEVMIPAR